MKISMTLEDASMPRTVYWQLFREALQRNPRYVADPLQADLLFPAEDTALETNWPRYGKQTSAYIRGTLDEQVLLNYLNRIAQGRGPYCVVSMYPSQRLTWAFASMPHVMVADVSLSQWERTLNPRCISMPTLPISLPRAGAKPVPRNILASFRGAPSHPCRQSLARLHDGMRYVCELAPVAQHAGLVDATTGAADAKYVDIMQRSVFAFVPRGDCQFSYRLTEAMAFGCIPVVISDGWLLPFDRPALFDGQGSPFGLPFSLSFAPCRVVTTSSEFS